MRARQGSMLVLALWSLSLLALFSLSLGFGVRQKAMLLSRLSTLDALYPIAYSGVEQAKSLVRSDANFDVDTLTDAWAAQRARFQRIALHGGTFSLVTDGLSPVVDEERKVNLNHTSVEIVSRLLQRVSGLDRDESDELVYNLLDWMDSDSFFGHPDYGAEDSYYENLRKPYSAKDAPYEVLDELLLVKGMTPEIFTRIKPFITVYGSGQVNLNTAGREVLAALGFSPLGVETIAKYRAGADGEDGTSDDRLFANVGSVANDISVIGGTPLDASQVVLLSGLVMAGRVGVVSSAFQVTSLGVLDKNGASVEVEAVFNRTSQVLYLRVGEVRWPART